MAPGIVNGGQGPEIALGIPHDPLSRRSLHKNGPAPLDDIHHHHLIGDPSPRTPSHGRRKRAHERRAHKKPVPPNWGWMIGVPRGREYWTLVRYSADRRCDCITADSEVSPR